MAGAFCDPAGCALFWAPTDDPPPHPFAAIKSVNKNGNTDMRGEVRIKFSLLMGSWRSGEVLGLCVQV
jgi:hypothetical protein